MVLGLIVYGIGFFAMTFLARKALIIYIVFACIGALGMYLFMINVQLITYLLNIK